MKCALFSWQSVTPVPRLFLRVASLLYVGVLVADVYLNIIASTAPWRIAAFIGLMLALLVVEQWTQRLYELRTSTLMAVIFLLVRMGLIELIAAVDSVGISRVLYPLIPFAAYFSLGQTASYGLAGFYVCAFVVKLSLFVPFWYVSKEAVSELLMLFIGMVFALSMARVACEAEKNWRRAEQLLGDLAVSHQKLKAYAEQAAELAMAQERNRLARDIHDGLGHYLVAINVLLEKIIAFRQRDPREADQAALDARRLTHEALQDVRQSVGALRVSGEVFSLAAALADLVKNTEQERLTVNWQVSGNETGFSKTILQTLYRAAQEALTNVQKHARASHVDLLVLLHAHEASLAISDNGEGFDISLLDRLPSDRDNRFGLQGIRERLEALGGILEVESSLDRGTRLAVSIPRRLSEMDQSEGTEKSNAGR